jgi:cysteine sulfinate desulfinase/cysteine desulfurase-like protein
MREIVNSTKTLLDTEEGVVVVTAGSAESLSKVLHPSYSVIASFLEPEEVTTLPHCSILPIRRSGIRAWNTYLTDPGKFSHAFISAVNAEYGVVSDLPELSAMIKSIAPSTVVLADLSYAMDPAYFRGIVDTTDVVLFDGSFCGAPHVGVIWAKDPEHISVNTASGHQQFGMRAGYLHEGSCSRVAEGIRAVIDIQDEDVRAVRNMRTRLEACLQKIPGVYLNFQGAPKAEHTANFHIEGIWTRPLTLALRESGLLVTDTVDGLRNVQRCTPLTSYMFEEPARYSNLLIRVGRHTTEEDVDKLGDAVASAINALQVVFPIQEPNVIVEEDPCT